MNNEQGRFADMGSSCIAYYRFNSDSSDKCTDDTTSLTLHGDASVSSAGKMGNGLTLDGSGDYAQASDDGAFIMNSDWSIEAWIKADATNQGTIIAIADGDGTEEDDDFWN